MMHKEYSWEINFLYTPFLATLFLFPVANTIT